ncbi:hypothetical protein V5J73_07000 [Flavobacterium sp. KS-LB2]|uniref:hypothetical protein n=1 Tax=Flavobacterium sp. KS-LB2 TaxID=3120525 RepID=UPI0030D271D5
MHARTRSKLLGLGFDTLLINKIDVRHLTVSGLSNQNKKALLVAGFTDVEADLITLKVNRAIIDPVVIQSIIDKSGSACCFCEDGIVDKPFQIHHIEEYHVNQNHSEENLLLVCPTHHVQIHQHKYKRSDQIHIKRKWENLWQVAKLFLDKGLSFPFKTIEFVDYTSEGSITEIFNYGAPRPSVCVVLSKGSLSENALQVLNAENKLVITGDSGSGKTTMVFGIAGAQIAKNVYKYTIADNSDTKSSAEILQFLSLVKNVILIVDDANAKLHGEHIERILSAADVSRQIIVVNTRNDFKNNNDIEEHFLNSVKYISWSEIKHSVKSSLLSNEIEIVDFLKAKKLDDINHFPLGYSELSTSLNYLIDSYLNSSETVWQFIFLIGGGLEKVGDIKLELQQRDRFDIIFLYLSIKQISQFEKGCSVEEIMQLFKTNSILKVKSQPEREWLQERLDTLCARRFLKNERGRYKTIHRQFARKFIEHFYKISPVECSELLDVVFKNYSNVKEITILWSWLSNSDASRYLANWCNPANTDWNSLVETTCYESVETLGLLARLMRYTANQCNDKTVNSAFKDRAEEIAMLINTEKLNYFYAISEIFTTLSNHAKEVIVPMCDLLDKKSLTKLIKEARPEDFKYIYSIFQNIWEVHPAWIFDVTKGLNVKDFEKALNQVKKGDVESIDRVMQFFSAFIFDLHRSHIKTATTAVCNALKGCPIKEMDYPVFLAGLFPVAMYENDIEKILSVLDSEKLADELANATPRYWKPLLNLSIFSMQKHMKKLEEIIEKVDLEILMGNVEKYYQDSHYEFRILIYLFCNGSKQKKAAFALKIHPLVKNIYSKVSIDGHNHNDIIEAFNILSPSDAAAIVQEYSIIFKNEKKERSKAYKLDKVLKQAEASGSDYILFKRTIDVKQFDVDKIKNAN